jgi:hypothetical protein
MAKLRRKNPRSHPHIAPPDMPSGGVSAPQEISARAMYERISMASIRFTSSHGDLKSLFIFHLPL